MILDNVWIVGAGILFLLWLIVDSIINGRIISLRPALTPLQKSTNKPLFWMAIIAFSMVLIIFIMEFLKLIK